MPWSYEHRYQDLSESIFLKREMVYSVFEYCKDKVLLATRTSVLLFHGRQFVKVFADANTLHVPKGELNTVDYFDALPGFDVDKFPFVACSGSQGIRLINLNHDNIETLVVGEPTCERGQPAFFFTEINSGYSIHFTNRRNMQTGIEKL